MRIQLVAAVALLVCTQACANTSEPAESGPDAGIGEPSPPPTPPGSQCGTNQHACNGSCVATQANEPSVGCALGCGEPCPAPADGAATCTEAGSCSISCSPGYAAINGECVLFSCFEVDYTCGSFVDDAGSSFYCGSCASGVTCGSDHQCVIAPDASEPNDTVAQAKNLGDLNDASDPVKWVDNLTIDTDTDEDWFRFHITDGFDAGNPNAYVGLETRGQTVGALLSSHELTVWFKCDGTDDGSKVKCGEWYTIHAENNLNSPTLGKGCRWSAQYVPYALIEPSCSGTSENGTVTIRARKPFAPRGDSYDLHVEVD